MRESGILMHITSLPGPYGIGSLGKCAYEFVDFLESAGQTLWQILPLNPTGFGNSPYQSCSAYAGNEYLIDLQTLIDEGLLSQQEADSICWQKEDDRIDFGILYANRLSLLRHAYARFAETDDFTAFCRENSFWLSDYALYRALKDACGGKPWYLWDKDLKDRQTDAIWRSRQQLKDEIRFYSFLQFQFFKQWNALRQYAKEKHVRIIGDVPIYVPYDCVEVWCDPELFQLDASRTPTDVAGVPPDGFTPDGQLWGNPLYRWEVMKKDGYQWWIRRLRHAGSWYDILRLDHFRAFEAYWSVPYGEETARGGKWVPGPGMHFLQTVKNALPGLSFIAEDLGFLTQEVFDLRDSCGFPGMKVLLFAFDSKEPSDYLPHNCTENSVCYAGTHDNMTVRQWLESADRDTKSYAAEYMRLNPQEGNTWGVIRTAMSTVCRQCIIQMQDYLDLGPQARMNFPGTQSEDNWTWRAKEGSFTPSLSQKIKSLSRLYGRGTDLK